MTNATEQMATLVATALVSKADDLVVREAAQLAHSLMSWQHTVCGDSLLDELNAQFDTDEELQQLDGREELQEALAELELKEGETWLHEAKRKAVARLLMIGISKRMFAMATDYERITGKRNESGWSSDYATEETRHALYVRGGEDEPLMAALEQRWAPLELVKQHTNGMTVYDWRWDETWRYTGKLQTIEELNASLYRNGNCYGESIKSLCDDFGEYKDWMPVEVTLNGERYVNSKLK